MIFPAQPDGIERFVVRPLLGGGTAQVGLIGLIILFRLRPGFVEPLVAGETVFAVMQRGRRQKEVIGGGVVRIKTRTDAHSSFDGAGSRRTPIVWLAFRREFGCLGQLDRSGTDGGGVPCNDAGMLLLAIRGSCWRKLKAVLIFGLLMFFENRGRATCF
ncbi:hypothetical protein [Ralstonia solanacearum]|uniref:hypothetical protein n=1 Tax=Ralstonia solanacearum TaxID=305 RepID=UPI001E322024|nr:hypothetical protein [Ralstonia solanacearum]